MASLSRSRRTGVAGLALREFRCFEALSIDLTAIDAPDCPAVALVGANGAGKTSVLEALSLLGPGRGLRGVASEKLARRPLSHKVALVSPSELDEPAQGWSVVAELAGATGSAKSLSAGRGGRAQTLPLRRGGGWRQTA